MKKFKKTSGIALVEAMLAMAIFAIFSIGAFYLSIDTVQRDTKISMNTEALLYAQEGIEATKSIGNRNFLLLENGDHGLLLSGGAWNFALAPETISAEYSRTITVSDVYRNGSGNIDEAGTILDPDTKKITSEVTWTQKGIIPRTVSLDSYITNWKGDDWVMTTCTEFNAGTFEDTENMEEESPPDDNCSIKLALVEDASGFFSSANVGKHAKDVVVDGNYAYLAVDDMSKGLQIVNVSTPNSPVIVATKDISEKGKTITKDGNYVYVGIREKSHNGVKILNVSNPLSPQLSSSIHTEHDGNALKVLGNYLYLGIEHYTSSFLSYDITNKSSPVLKDTINFGDEVQAIKISGNYAYVGLDDDNHGFRVVNISNPLNMTEIANLDLNEEVNAITISGSLAFVGTEKHDESLQVVDISTPGNPELIKSVDVNGEIKDLAIQGDYLYAAVDETHEGLAAINISNPYNPTLAYSLNVSGKGTGIDADENYIYVTTDTANKGLVIIGATVEGIATNGTYTSTILDTESENPRYNFIEWEFTNTASGSIKFQLRTADSEENIESATWVGKDGTDQTYYENSRTIIELDPGRSGERYCQFKAFVSSDGVSSPTLESVKINFTP